MNLKKIISKAPSSPGIYLFGNGRGKTLYVGKAANLRARLRSYLVPGWKEDMLREAKTLLFKELSSDIEALIEESRIIKGRKPHYNILFRDDKNYFFTAITRDKFPRIYLTHQPQGQKSKIKNQKSSDYIGPFTDGDSIKRVLRLLRTTFPYCTCSPKTRHKRRCVNAEIGKCLGFCCTDIPSKQKEKTQYRANINAIKKILNGKSRALKKELAHRMQTFAEKRKYEEARTSRDQLASLERIFEHSPYLKKEITEERSRALLLLKNLLGLAKVPLRIEGYDISHHQGSSSVGSMVVFENGMPQKNAYRKFIIRSISGINDPAMIGEVLRRRLAHPEWETPDLILVDGGKAQLGAARAIVAKDIPLVALAKREEELYIPGKKEPTGLMTLPPPLLYLLTSIRDEAHRFAISFHRRRHSRLVLKS